MPLDSDGRGQIIQAFPLTKDFVNLTGGTHEGVRMINCVEDGAITINRLGTSVSMIAGDVYTVDVTFVTITSGKFHLA